MAVSDSPSVANQTDTDPRQSLLERHKGLARERLAGRTERQQERDAAQGDKRNARWSEADTNRDQRLSAKEARISDQLASATGDKRREKIEARLAAHKARAAEINRSVDQRRDDRVSARAEAVSNRRTTASDGTRSRIRERIEAIRERRRSGKQEES
jgi:hypothetical protein